MHALCSNVDAHTQDHDILKFVARFPNQNRSHAYLMPRNLCKSIIIHIKAAFLICVIFAQALFAHPILLNVTHDICRWNGRDTMEIVRNHHHHHHYQQDDVVMRNWNGMLEVISSESSKYCIFSSSSKNNSQSGIDREERDR